jgi:hypothetical protein
MEAIPFPVSVGFTIGSAILLVPGPTESTLPLKPREGEITVVAVPVFRALVAILYVGEGALTVKLFPDAVTVATPPGVMLALEGIGREMVLVPGPTESTLPLIPSDGEIIVVAVPVFRALVAIL